MAIYDIRANPGIEARKSLDRQAGHSTFWGLRPLRSAQNLKPNRSISRQADPRQEGQAESEFSDAATLGRHSVPLSLRNPEFVSKAAGVSVSIHQEFDRKLKSRILDYASAHSDSLDNDQSVGHDSLDYIYDLLGLDKSDLTKPPRSPRTQNRFLADQAHAPISFKPSSEINQRSNTGPKWRQWRWKPRHNWLFIALPTWIIAVFTILATLLAAIGTYLLILDHSHPVGTATDSRLRQHSDVQEIERFQGISPPPALSCHGTTLFGLVLILCKPVGLDHYTGRSFVIGPPRPESSPIAHGGDQLH